MLVFELMQIGKVNLDWLGHAGFRIKTSEGKNIYIDPFQISAAAEKEKADIILITHSHFDHCSLDDINKVIKPNTRVVITADGQSKVARTKVPIKIEIVEPGKELDLGSIRINAVPAYNIDKSFHPKDEAWVGYVVKVDDVIIYHSGDTDVIPEMQKLTGYKKNGTQFVALLPIGGRFTMNTEEALEASKIIKPNLVIPMHYGKVIGSKDDAEDFVKMCKEEGIEAKIIEIAD
jgi:L-ascorbate metabolism protein UlaG (beta-lactamase superfamily)